MALTVCTRKRTGAKRVEQGIGKASLEVAREILDARDHRAAGIERQIDKARFRVEGPHGVVDGMGQESHAGDGFRRDEGAPVDMKQQVGGMALPLIVLVDGELAEQQRRHDISAVALLGLRQERAFDLGGAQREIADNAARAGFGKDGDARRC